MEPGEKAYFIRVIQALLRDSEKGGRSLGGRTAEWAQHLLCLERGETQSRYPEWPYRRQPHICPWVIQVAHEGDPPSAITVLKIEAGSQWDATHLALRKVEPGDKIVSVKRVISAEEEERRWDLAVQEDFERGVRQLTQECERIRIELFP